MQLDKARVTLWNGERFKLVSPEVFGDSLRGVLKDGTIRSVALADVKKLEMQTVDPVRSTILADFVLCTMTSALFPDSSCTSDDEEYTVE
jgi:hypothetical protein